jgi:hypothetical protein
MASDLLQQAMDEKPEPAPAWRLAFGGVPDLVTAATCWLAWQQPRTLGAEWVKIMVIVVLSEFFVIHSGAFMAAFGNMPKSRLGRIGAHLGLAAFYFLFIWAIAASLDAHWLFAVFGWLFFSKILVSWSAGRGSRMAIREQMIDWPFAVAAYLGSIMLGFVVLEGASGGITERVFLDAGLKDAGLFEDKPWVALSAGTFYFSAVGLWRMRIWRWRFHPAAAA